MTPTCFRVASPERRRKMRKKVFRRKPKTLFAFSIANKQIKSWKKQLKSGGRRWWNARGRRWNESALREDLFTSIQKIIYLRRKALVWKLLIFRRQTEDLQGKKGRSCAPKYLNLTLPNRSRIRMRAAGRLRVDSGIIENISSRALEFLLQVCSMTAEVKCVRWFLMDAQWQSSKALGQSCWMKVDSRNSSCYY